ncbi:MAG TPA: hypothetical protein VGS09_03635 [Actinomycetota bacterium]|jgi:hypothetical protein|nr:hypothetical protein [Actinomycetota bacterium]
MLPVLILLAAVALWSCAEHRVLLASRPNSGAPLTFRLELSADVERTLEGETRGQQIEAAFRVVEEVLSRQGDGTARARLTLAPISLQVDGREVTVGPGQEFVVTMAPDGRIVEIEESTGEPAEALAPVGLERLLPRLGPVLPRAPVGIGESWTSDTEFADETGSFSVALRSSLARLGMRDGEAAALVRTTYVSPVRRREVFANAVAEIDGEDVGTQEAWFALDGFLIRASGDSVGSYRVTFRPPGGEDVLEPVRGSLDVRLHTELSLVSGTG